MTRNHLHPQDMDSHLHDQQAEDVAFLTDVAGLTHEAACARVGVSPDTLERRTQRRRGRAVAS